MWRAFCCYFEHQRRFQFEGCVAEPVQNITAIVEMELIASSRRASRCLERGGEGLPGREAEGFCGGHRSLPAREEQGAAGGWGEGCEDVEGKKWEKKGLKLSITEGGKEEKSKVIPSCRYLEEKLQDCSKREREGLADSVETFGVDLRKTTKNLGAKGKARRRHCDERSSIARRNRRTITRGLCEEVGEDWAWSLRACGKANLQAFRLQRR